MNNLLKALMKAFLAAAMFSTFSFGMKVESSADPKGKGKGQNQAKLEEAKAKQEARFTEVLEKLPEGVKEKVLAAKEAAKEAKKKLDNMEMNGATPEDIQKEVENRRAEARMNLQKAIDALDGVGEKAQARVEKAKNKIQQRLDERKAEATEAAK